MNLEKIENGVIEICREVGEFIAREGASFDRGRIEQKTVFNNLVSYVDKEAEKTYWAIVKNAPPKTEDTLTHYLKRNPKQNKSYAHIKEVPESKKAVLHYKLLKKLDNYYLLEIVLETGRHHQIRSQLSAIGCSIKGDLKYGFDRSNADGSIHLHARKLTFTHPVQKEKVTVQALPPNEAVWNAWN